MFSGAFMKYATSFWRCENDSVGVFLYGFDTKIVELQQLQFGVVLLVIIYTILFVEWEVKCLSSSSALSSMKSLHGIQRDCCVKTYQLHANIVHSYIRTRALRTPFKSVWVRVFNSLIYGFQQVYMPHRTAAASTSETVGQHALHK